VSPTISSAESGNIAAVPVAAFAKKYRITRLVYAEEYDNPTDAIAREKQLKGWRRERKNELVRSINPEFRDLMPSA
jgi:putative endonuclease